ncbi:MAG: NAD-binding protein, partial [Candidatus Kapaibacterium sp.]
NDLKNRGEDFVVIELSGQTEERLLEKGYPYVIGDAEDNSVLIRAGIERARGLVAALDTDAANVLTVLSARELRADLLIVARATNENTEGTLRRAGADRVVSPDAIGGHRLALALLQPKVHDFLGKIFNIEELDVYIGEIVIDERSRLAGITVAGTNFKDRWNVTILAIQTTGEEFIISPDAQRVIVPGETLIVIGPLQAISRIEAEFSA